MATNKNELDVLSEIQNGGVAFAALTNNDRVIHVDAATREIAVPDWLDFIAVKNDHESDTIYFDIDRYIDGEDLSRHTCAIQYSVASGSSTASGISNIISMDTASVPNKILFGWNITNDLTRYSGTLTFSVRFYTLSNGVFEYNYNTLPATSRIANTLDVRPSIITNAINNISKVQLIDIQDDTVKKTVVIPESSDRYIIDPVTRSITIPSGDDFIAVKGDHNANTIYFEIDRNIDDVDLYEKTCVVQFSKSNTADMSRGLCPITSFDITEDNKLVFGWDITNDVTNFTGDIRFSVMFYSIDKTSEKFSYCFNTLPVVSKVLDTINVRTAPIYDVKPSILHKWVDEIKQTKAETEYIRDNVFTDEYRAEVAQQVVGLVPTYDDTDIYAELNAQKTINAKQEREIRNLKASAEGYLYRFEESESTDYRKQLEADVIDAALDSIGGHTEAIDGELVSADVESVEVGGRNLIDQEEYVEGYWLSGIWHPGPNLAWCVYLIPCVPGQSITISGSESSNGTNNVWLSKPVNATENYIATEMTSSAKDHNRTHTAPVGAYALAVGYTKTAGKTNLQAIYGSIALPYAPYHPPVTRPIPDAIRSLPGYGWSAGSVFNEVDFEKKQYVQRVGEYVLPAQSAFTKVGTYYQVANILINYAGGTNDATAANWQIPSFGSPRNPDGKEETVPYVWLFRTSSDYCRISKSVYDYLATNSIAVNYVLLEPIITDISALLPDDFGLLDVEGGGTITFAQAGGTELPVPNKETFMIKLGGTTA